MRLGSVDISAYAPISRLCALITETGGPRHRMTLRNREQLSEEMTARYFEDFAVGQTFGSGRRRIEAERIKSFAAEFDPQPFHLDEAAARGTLFGGLVASGWHTAAITMRLVLESNMRMAGGTLGLGAEVRWSMPVRPGDRLHVQGEVIEAAASRSRPDRGKVSTRCETLNDRGEVVQLLIARLLVPRRSTAEPVR